MVGLRDMQAAVPSPDTSRRLCGCYYTRLPRAQRGTAATSDQYCASPSITTSVSLSESTLVLHKSRILPGGSSSDLPDTNADEQASQTALVYVCHRCQTYYLQRLGKVTEKKNETNGSVNFTYGLAGGPPCGSACDECQASLHVSPSLTTSLQMAEYLHS